VEVVMGTETMFAIAGRDPLLPELTNGVWISNDTGNTFSFINATGMITWARFGAYPSATTWYLSGAHVPGEEPPTLPLMRAMKSLNYTMPTAEQCSASKEKYIVREWMNSRLTRLIDLCTRRQNILLSSGHERDLSSVGRDVESDMLLASAEPRAEVMKTINGGKTWHNMFFKRGFYFNQIGCGSEDVCVAVGESGAFDSSVPGIHVLTTQDGGHTWNETLYVKGAGLSLQAVQFLSETEVWVAGGIGIAGIFYYSSDGGVSWVESKFPGFVLITDLAFPANGNGDGYAVGFTDIGFGGLLKYTA